MDPSVEAVATNQAVSQRIRALERANEVRLARAHLKRRISEGDVSAADVILEMPASVVNMSIGDLLMSRPRWGVARTRKFLARFHISASKPIGALTWRQRSVLAAELPSSPEVTRDADEEALENVRASLRTAGDIAANLDRQARQAVTERDRLIVQASEQGLSRREVAELAQVSTARVQQIVVAHATRHGAQASSAPPGVDIDVIVA